MAVFFNTAHRGFDKVQSLLMKFKKLTPNLMVADVRRAVVFYRDLCGFSVVMAMREDGKTVDQALVNGTGYVFAILVRDSVELMLQQAENLRSELPGALKTRAAGFSCTYYVEIEGVEALYEHIKTIAPDAVRLSPHTSSYGMREFCVEDCDGHVLVFAERAQAQS